MKGDSLVERLVYRLIKKHIAGTTMNSVIDKVQEFNKEKIPASILFLSGTADSKSKARYATTTYLELIRRISRLGLKASVHIPMEQIGSAIDHELSYNNMLEIINAGNKYGVFVWAEMNGNPLEAGITERLRHSKGFGVAAPHDKISEIVRKIKPKAAKIIFDGKSENTNPAKLLSEAELVARSTNTAVLSFLPDKVLGSVMNSKYKKSVIIEFGMGTSRSKIKKVISKGGRASVSVPFGKDWTSYAMEIVPEGKTHFIVSRLINEERMGAV